MMVPFLHQLVQSVLDGMAEDMQMGILVMELVRKFSPAERIIRLELLDASLIPFRWRRTSMTKDALDFLEEEGELGGIVKRIQVVEVVLEVHGETRCRGQPVKARRRISIFYAVL